MASTRAQNIWRTEHSFYSRVICQKSSEQKTPPPLVCREPETSIAIWPVVSLLFSASQSDCLFVSAAFQDDDLSKNVMVFSRKGVSFNRPSYLRRSIEKWTTSLSLNLNHCLTSKKNSINEQSVSLASWSVACCMTAWKGFIVQLNTVLIAGLGQGVIKFIRVCHFQTLLHANRFYSCSSSIS